MTSPSHIGSFVQQVRSTFGASPYNLIDPPTAENV
jgi:hypothetical protein